MTGGLAVAEVVRQIGALAGLAAVLGLGVLAVLYVAHAREVRRLRAWAGRSPERAAAPAPARAARPRWRHRHRYRRRRLRLRRRLGPRAVAAAVAVLALGIAAVHQLRGGQGAGQDDAAAGAQPKRPAAAVRPGDVTVAVLNATTVPGLAAALRDRLTARGFRGGTIADFNGSSLTASVVQYAPGHEAQAEAVGRALGVRAREPATAAVQALAAGATVVVVAGADAAP